MKKSIVVELQELVEQLGNLRDGLPVTDPSYKGVGSAYRKASNCMEGVIGKLIDEADADYVAFSQAIQVAMGTLQSAIKKTEKAAKIIGQVARVVDLAGKVAARV